MIAKIQERFERDHLGNSRELARKNSTDGNYVLPSINDAWSGYLTAILWKVIESEPPSKPGTYLVAVDNEGDEYEVCTMELKASGDWYHEGEPCYSHSYYFQPIFWMECPLPPQK